MELCDDVTVFVIKRNQPDFLPDGGDDALFHCYTSVTLTERGDSEV